ncbi:RNA polymerase I associated factor, A49-like protein [Phycomyces nitens]|nr:RNA polymerase I associated factor, A49-like protein [Phycomyces nitens]
MGKRKQSEGTSSTQKYVKINLAEPQADVETPYLAMFPGTQPPSTTVFTALKRQGTQSTKRAAQRMVTTETDKVTYKGATFGEEEAQNLYCKYLVGVYSKKDNSLTVTPAPVLRMSRSVKALTNENKSTTTNSNAFGAARAALGLAFGTSKAQQDLRNEERNKVVGEELESMMDIMHTEISKATKNVPTQKSLQKEMANDLPIPSYDIDAESPEKVYDIDSIVSEEELNATPIKDILKETTLEGIQTHLAYDSSSFVNNHLLSILKSSGKKDRKKIRTLVYISYLMAYLCRVRSDDLNKRSKVETVLKGAPSMLIDKMTERYTVSKVRTPLMADKILCYLLVLCLAVADYTLIIHSISKDLSIKPSKATSVLRNLGCKIEPCNAEDIKRAGGNTNTNPKKAVLVVPLKFPEIRKFARK